MIRMSKNYKRALGILNKISMSGSRPGFERINSLLQKLGNPQKNFKCIIVGGTNGKGSTVTFLSKILECANYKTGSFFSPHIFSFLERIQINSELISEDDFANLFFEVYEKFEELEDKPTFFETLCAMAFLHFSKNKCDYAVMEVGMGGRLDATNACEPQLSIITNVSFEHTKHLGDSIEKIAFEKSGIMRENRPVVIGSCGDELDVLMQIANKKGAISHFVKDKFKIKKTNGSKMEINYNFPKTFRAYLNSTADFSANNSACSAMAAQILGVENTKIIAGLQSAVLRGRWEKISESPKIIVDCAHNLGAFLQIEPLIKKEFDSDSILLFCAMKDKNYGAELELLSKYFSTAVFCFLESERSLDVKTLVQAAKKIGFENIHKAKKSQDAFLLAKKLSNEKKPILICGSIYLLQTLFSNNEIFVSG